MNWINFNIGKLMLISFFLLSKISLAQFQQMGNQYNISNFGANYGVSVVDTNNDNLDDIYISCRSGEQNLHFNNLETKFEKINIGVSYRGSTNNSLWFDYNNDGFTDVYLGNAGSTNLLYKNNGDGTFTDMTEFAGVGSTKSPISLIAGDLNNDGWLDLYAAIINEQNELYLNNGDGTFTDFILQSRALDTQVAMGSMFFDYDNDGDLDIYLTHDNNQPNILYQNQGNATFINVSANSGANFAGFCMGVDFADFNKDGWLDIYIANLYENTLLINNGDGTFNDLSTESGTNDYGMGWGTNALDYDNDGWIDIYAVNNSFFSDYPNILYRNEGDLTFSDASSGTDLESRYAGYGSASLDVENDGDLDLVVANSGGSGGVELFINEGNENNWIGFSLEGKESNRSAIGVRAEVYSNGNIQIDEVAAGTGYVSQSSLKLHFGLGENSNVDSVIFKWPSGKIDSYYNLEPNTYYKGIENSGISRFDEITSFRQEISNSRLDIYPNPTNGLIRINLVEPEEKEISVELINTHGLTIKNIGVLKMNYDQVQVDISDVKPGLYFLMIGSRNQTIVKTIIKN